VAERLDDLCASFIRHLRAEGKAERTRRLYAMSVRMFADWLTHRGRPATLEELTRSAIREWLAELADTRGAADSDGGCNTAG
jgi:site-specific recombinase XerD